MTVGCRQKLSSVADAFVITLHSFTVNSPGGEVVSVQCSGIRAAELPIYLAKNSHNYFSV